MKVAIDLESFVHLAADAMVAARRDGSIILWNQAAERIFGYSESEALGQSLDLIIPERFRERHWQGYHQVMQTGLTRYAAETLRVPALHKDGRTLSIAFTVTLLSSPGNNDEKLIVAIIRDDSARWQEERALRQQLADLQALRSRDVS